MTVKRHGQKKTRHVKGYTACIENNDGSRFANGSKWLYSAPFRDEGEAYDWAEAFPDTLLVRVESNMVHPSNFE